MDAAMARKLTPPIKWHGGKHYLASWIIDQMPPHLHYVEPYLGGGAVLLARDPVKNWLAEGDEKLLAKDSGCSEVVNDVNGQLTNFWNVLRNPELFQQMQRILELTPFSAVEWKNSTTQVQSDDPVEAAAGFFICARQSRQGLMTSFATLSRKRTRRNVNEQVASYLNAIDGLADVHRRLQAVVIFNDDACQVIRRQDGNRTLYYCDPPYIHESRTATSAYAFEMDTENHIELLETLSTIEGKFLLSGYRSKLYDDHADKHGWRREDRLIDNKSSSTKEKEIKCECLWMNFEARTR